MLVVYNGRSTEGRFIQVTPEHEVYAPHGEPVDVPDEVAARLLERADWSTPKPSKADKAAAPKE